MLNRAASTRLFCISLTSILTLAACGGSSSNEETRSLQPPNNQPPQINQPTAIAGPLSQTTSDNVERFIKNGIYATSVADNTTSTPAAENNVSDSAGNFSTTNTIEQGVDEADRVKYDGSYLYLAQTNSYFTEANSTPTVRVLKRNPDFTLTALPKIQSSLDFSVIDGIYLHEQTLSVIGNDFDIYTTLSDPATNNSIPAGITSDKISISIFNVSDPANAIETLNLQIDGDISATRRIDDNLYIVSNYYASYNDVISGASTDEEKLQNYTQINSAPIDQMMPKLSIDGTEQQLTNIENCYIPEQASEDDGNPSFVFVTKINLSNPNEIESLCVSAHSSLIYSSANNLYVIDTDFINTTNFHKISLDDLSYQASGSVSGVLGWRSDPAFRVDEANGQLRVVSSDYSQTEPQHTLNVLSQNGRELQSIARLPNDQNPEAIGKPREDIFAVRFIDDKAYIVTFERIDPLYVINLSDGANPYIEGSLEIPGFSSYIHPLSNNYLLGVGQQVAPNVVFPTNDEVTPPAVTSGMKISLFDINDPSAPIELTNIVTPFAYTPVEFNYKTLSVLENSNAYQFAIPYQQWASLGENGEQVNLDSSINALMLLETNTADATPSLDLIEAVKTPGDGFFYYTPSDRSIIHGDKVYYLRGNDVYLADWAAQSEVLGPF